MALNDDATLVIEGGNFFIAPYLSGGPTAIPADLSAPGAPWEKIGHTAVDSPLNLAREGGDESTLATLQNSALRTKRTKLVRSMSVEVQQWDTDSLKLYFGSNATIDGDGNVRASDAPVPTVVTFCAIYNEGDEYFALYAEKAEIFDADDIAAADTESLAGMPLKVKFLQHSTNTWSLTITPLGESGS